jgi:TonB family protein
MNRLRNALLALCILLAASACFGQTPPQPAPPAAYTLVVAIPSYPDSEQGLQKLLGDMTKLIKDGDTQTLAAHAKSLALPNPDAWFVSVFGNDLGPDYAAASEKQRSSVATLVPATLAALLKQGRTRIEAHKFERSCDPFATDKEYPLLLRRDHLAPLYHARFLNTSNTASIWSYFAYVDGGFRYLGNLPAQVNPAPGKRQPPPEPPEKILVGGIVQSAKILRQKMPEYPAQARDAHIQGDVVIHAIIGKDGQIHDMEVIQGICSLSEAALAAVKHWTYSPTLLAGNPVEVDTTITVSFRLGD